MTVHKYYIGGLGPYLYDDTEALLDPDGDFPGEFQNGIITSGTIKAEQVPSATAEVLRFDDLGSLILSAKKVTESFTETGTISYLSNIILATGTYDLFLPTLALGEKRVYDVKNDGTGVITLKPGTTEPLVEIEGETSQPLNPGDCATVISDLTDWSVI